MTTPHNKGKQRVQGIQCPRCKEKIWSKYTHDFHYCGCGYCFVDGGRGYLRYGYGVKLPKGMRNDGTVSSLIWEDIAEQNKQIGKPKAIYMYVPKPRQLTPEEEKRTESHA